MSASASDHVVRQALNKVEELNPQYLPVSRIHCSQEITDEKIEMLFEHLSSSTTKIFKWLL